MKRFALLPLVGMFLVGSFTAKAYTYTPPYGNSILRPTQTFEDLDPQYKFEHDGHIYYQRQGLPDLQKEFEDYQKEYEGEIEPDYRSDGDEDEGFSGVVTDDDGNVVNMDYIDLINQTNDY